jgi:hypothetical protein
MSVKNDPNGLILRAIHKERPCEAQMDYQMNIIESQMNVIKTHAGYFYPLGLSIYL